MEVLRVFPTPESLAGIIDSTLLKPELPEKEYLNFLRRAKEKRFCCVFLPLYYLPYARMELEGSGVKPGGVVGFPFGYVPDEVKKAEAVYALQQGAREIDMVINVTAIKSRRYNRVEKEIAEVVNLARLYDRGKGEGHTVVKVILETCYLDREEIKAAALIAQEQGADFVKSSTGLGPGGAREEDIAFLREILGPTMGIKASGGIRNLADLLKMVMAGATRIGTSSAEDIMEEYYLYHGKSDG